MKKLTKYTLATGASLALFAAPMMAGAQFSPNTGITGSGLSNQSVFSVLVTIMKQALVFLTILGVLGFIISGIIYITAGGAGKADTAQKWLQYSILGIIVGLIGYIIVALLSNILVSGGVQSGGA